MPECHRCQHNGTESPACLKCRGPAETNHRGHRFVSLDSGTSPQTGAEVEASLAQAYEPQTVEAIDLPECCTDTARRLLATLCGLPDEDLLLLVSRLRGQSLASIARRDKKTRQAAHARWKRLVSRHPELAAVCP